MITFNSKVEPERLIAFLQTESTSLIDYKFKTVLRFQKSWNKVGVFEVSNNAAAFLIRNSWTSTFTPIAFLIAVKQGDSYEYRLSFKRSPITKVAVVITFGIIFSLCAFELFSLGKPTLIAIFTKTVVCTLAGALFSLPVVLISAHGRNEVKYFLEDLMRTIENGKQ